jgi:H+/Cl- antiporter ClcA
VSLLREGEWSRLFKEEFALFYSVFKWLVLAVVIGVFVWTAVSTFMLALEKCSKGVGSLPPWRILLLPLGLLASVSMVRYLKVADSTQGTESVVEAVHHHQGRIDVYTVIVKVIAAVITISTGGSLGQEGPSAQIGSAVSNVFATGFRLNDIDRRKLVVCGVSAGMASVFGAPVAGAVFGLEVLYVGQVFYDVLLPCIVSGMVSYQVSLNLGMAYIYQPLLYIPKMTGPHVLLWVVLAGVFFGLVALLFIEVLHLARRGYRKLAFHPLFSAFCGGLFLVLLSSVVGPRYVGLGSQTITDAITGQEIPKLAFFWKSLFTGLTKGAGGSGGVVTPTLFIGAASGATFASIFSLDPVLFSCIGFVAVLAGAANTPIAATILAAELFGSRVASLAAIASVIAFVVSGYRSIYPDQIVKCPKSPLLDICDEYRRVGEYEFDPMLLKLPMVRLVVRNYRLWRKQRKIARKQ